MKSRYDYFLIWGNGIRHKDEIISMIRGSNSIKILKIINHKPRSIARFVRTVYSYDYAPFEHLRAKTRYLLKSDPSLILIFVQNQNVQEAYYGTGAFRHIQCERMRRISEEIRDKFNKRIGGRRTEEHVVHVSDNEFQVDHMLKSLGFRNGIGLFKNIPNPILSIPYHIQKFDKFTLKRVSASQVYCSILRKSRSSVLKEVCAIEDTPHFACLMDDIRPYEEYLSVFGGSVLTDDHSVNNLLTLSRNFSYLREPYSTAYILAEEFRPDQYLIWDGVSRASILKSQGIDSFIIAVVK